MTVILLGHRCQWQHATVRVIFLGRRGRCLASASGGASGSGTAGLLLNRDILVRPSLGSPVLFGTGRK